MLNSQLERMLEVAPNQLARIRKATCIVPTIRHFDPLFAKSYDKAGSCRVSDGSA